MRLSALVLALSCVAAEAQDSRLSPSSPTESRHRFSASRPSASAYAETVRLAAVARAARDRGDVVGASAAASAACRLSPADLGLAKDAARLAFEAGDLITSSAAAVACLSLDPTDAEAWLVRARAVHVLAGPAAARDVLAAAERLAAPSSAVLRLRAELCCEAGDSDEAERLFAAGGGTDVPALRGLLGAAVRSGDDTTLTKTALRLLDAVGTRAEASADRTLALRALSRWKGADRTALLPAAAKAQVAGLGDLALSVDDLVAWAGFLDRFGDTVRATAIVGRALAIDPRHGPALALAAELAATAGDPEAARRFLLEGLADAEDKSPVRAAVFRSASESTATADGETAFLLVPAGLVFEGETLPLAGAPSYVKLRAIRVAAGSPKAVLLSAPVELSADHVRRASDALLAAGFVHVRFR